MAMRCWVSPTTPELAGWNSCLKRFVGIVTSLSATGRSKSSWASSLRMCRPKQLVKPRKWPASTARRLWWCMVKRRSSQCRRGTNHFAITSGLVDVLAHPGLLTAADALLAAQGDVFLEISARRGHSLTNGHVARVAQQAGARIIVNSDSHEPSDLLTAAFQERVASGAGLPDTLLTEILVTNPERLLERVLGRRVRTG